MPAALSDRRTAKVRPADLRYAARVPSWARTFIYWPTSRFGVMTSPPTITFGGGSSTVNNNYVAGQTAYSAQSAQLISLGSLFVDGTYAGFPTRIASHVTGSTGTKSAGAAPIRVRFMTDAPAIDFAFIDQWQAQFNLTIDGQYVTVTGRPSSPTPGNVRYIKCDFGADVVTYSMVAANYTAIAGGSGHAVGDIITLNGGTGSAGGTPAKIKVTSVTSGAVATYNVADKGGYTSLPTGNLSQASTTGSGTGSGTGTGTGTGATVSGGFYHHEHTSRKMRVVELVYTQPAIFLGIVVNANHVVLPVAANPAQPRLAVIGDSITNGTYLQYGGSHLGASIAQKLGMWDQMIPPGSAAPDRTLAPHRGRTPTDWPTTWPQRLQRLQRPQRLQLPLHRLPERHGRHGYADRHHHHSQRLDGRTSERLHTGHRQRHGRQHILGDLDRRRLRGGEHPDATAVLEQPQPSEVGAFR